MNPDIPIEVKIEELLKGCADYGKLELLRDAQHRIIGLRTQTAAVFEELADIVENRQLDTQELAAIIRYYAIKFKES